VNREAGDRPLAMRAQDDRGPAYTAAVERSEAAFQDVWAALGETPQLVDTAGDLAAIASALPPETGLTLDDAPRIAAGERPGEGWVTAVVATIQMMVERPVTPVRDNAGREHDVIVPALKLGTWLLAGPDAPVPAKTQACGYYARAIEALENDGPGVSLPAVSTLLRHIADLLAPGDYSPAQYLPDPSPAAREITAQVQRLRHVALRLAEIAPAAEAEENGPPDDDIPEG
jgi:hypothetical protein